MQQNVADLASGRATYSSDTFGLGPRLLLVALLTLSDRKKEARQIIARLLDVCEGFDAWPVPIAKFLQNNLSESEFCEVAMTGSDGSRLSGLAANRRQCRIEFYIGVRRALVGMKQEAIEMFRRSAARNVTVEPEWFLAHGLVRPR
jgi:lipoprotein NlpI